MIGLPAILSADRLKSSEMTHRWGDRDPAFPCANDLGAFRVVRDPMGICDIMMPPFSTKGENTALLYINRKHAPSEGTRVGYTWYPDRVQRRCEMDGFRIETVTRAAVRQSAALISVNVTNPSSGRRRVEAAVKVAGRMIRTIDGWAGGGPAIAHLSDHPETWRYDEQLGAMCFESQSMAFSVQGSRPGPDSVVDKSLIYNLNLKAGETWTLRFVVALGESEQQAAELFSSLADGFDKACQDVRDDWTEKIRSAFTPGNSVYSGHLPTLHTNDKALERLYYMSFLGGLFCRRNNPLSQLGVVYVTLMPDMWSTALFLWDIFLADTCYALLDPVVLRAQVESWLRRDLSSHLALDYVTGKAVGPWYAVNHTAVVHLAFTYLRYSGDLAWLAKEVDGKSIVDHLEAQALRWHELDKNGHGLADCGNGWNCGDGLTTWIHETAGFNAQWVGALRYVAELRQARGEAVKAKALRQDAEILLKNLWGLYVEGGGYWCAKQPDGRIFPARTLYDLYAVMDNISEDLFPKRRKEMAHFFETDLKTETWIRGLSPWDDDALRSSRPDWGWNGAYGAFPAVVANGLFKIGYTKGVIEWMRRVADTAYQGPIGQCHLVENVAKPFKGGARKSEIGGWTMVSTAAFVSMFVEGIFGVQATLRNGLQWRNQWGAFDRNASLENLQYQGINYRVTRRGVEEM